MRGYHQYFKITDQHAFSHRLFDVDKGFVMGAMDQGVRITTGAEMALLDDSKDFNQLETVLTFAKKVLPLEAAVESEAWCGTRPCMSDMKPVIGAAPKAIIEGPPRRHCPILLRQTSFKALVEAVSFKGADGQYESGQHTARFGEIEQRGVALTPKGRALYDQLLNAAREKLGMTPNEDNAEQYYQLLSESFTAFPDDYQTLHREQLAYFLYQVADKEDFANQLVDSSSHELSTADLQSLIQQDVIRIEPIVYEDFLPVSAAGIFQSNLHSDSENSYEGHSNKQEFEQALGISVQDELALYAQRQNESLQACLASLRRVA